MYKILITQLIFVIFKFQKLIGDCYLCTPMLVYGVMIDCSA